MNFLLQPSHLVIFAVVMFLVFFAMGKKPMRP
jgi:Sec-independent protein translocase protein TatA